MSLKTKVEENKEFKEVMLPVVYSYKEKREQILKDLNEEEFKDDLRKIKESSLENIDKLKKEAIKNLENNGIKVIEVKDSKDAEKILKKIIGNEKLIIKSKSNAANEIGLKEILKDKEIIETDLGDFIVDMCGKEDVHPVLPAVELTPKEIVEFIEKKFNKKVEPKAEEIAKFVRNHLREKICQAKIGITGANVISSEGSIIILENEGNVSLVSRIPDKHIIISSFDKIIPKTKEALEIVKAAGIYGTGQNFPVYVSIISGPSKTADIQNKIITGAQGAKEVYLLLIDNGRSEILNSDFKEILYCINCGSCLNFCPVYHQIAQNYGSKYFGSKGVLFSSFSENLKKSFDSGAFYCTSCQSCKLNCPIKINLPDLMIKLREKLVKEKIEPENAEVMIKNVKEFGNPFGKVEEGKIPKNLYCC